MFESITFEVKRILFICYIQSALLSGLTLFVLSKSHLASLDRAAIKLLRSMLKGQASGLHDGRYKAWNADQVRQFWGVGPSHIELFIRRLRTYGRWMKNPEAGEQPLAAILGDAQIDRDNGISRLTGGRPNAASTPWALQMSLDFETLANLESGTE